MSQIKNDLPSSRDAVAELPDPKPYSPDHIRDTGSHGTTPKLKNGGHLPSPVTLDAAAESRLILKIDLAIIPLVSLIYLWSFIDRANIGNAKIAGFEKDLGLRGYEFNIILTVQALAYFLCAIPSNVLAKTIGPGRFIPITTVLFGIAALATTFIHNFSQACAMRFLQGTFEAGMLPGIAYYLSQWYTRDEITFRLSLYLIMAPLAGAFSGLIASGILRLDSIGNVTSWRMIFLVEGVISTGIGLISLFTLTDRPETAPWLNPAEKEFAVYRVARERIDKPVLDKIDRSFWKKFWLAFSNPVTLTVSFIFLLDNITVQGLVFFLPTIVSAIYPKDSVVSQQWHTAPPNLVGALSSVVVPYLCSRFKTRQIFFIACAPLVITGYIISLATKDAIARYAATFLIAGGSFAFGALTNGQISVNSNSDTARTIGLAIDALFAQVGGLVATWAFLPFDAPNYHIGNGLNLATSSTMLLVCMVLLWWMKKDNLVRDKEQTKREQLLKESDEQDWDWKHPAFRWYP